MLNLLKTWEGARKIINISKKRVYIKISRKYIKTFLIAKLLNLKGKYYYDILPITVIATRLQQNLSPVHYSWPPLLCTNYFLYFFSFSTLSSLPFLTFFPISLLQFFRGVGFLFVYYLDRSRILINAYLLICLFHCRFFYI